MGLTLLYRTSRRVALAVLPAIVAALFLAPGALRAAESTSLTGTVAGVELCPQQVCGVAVFVGRFDGSLDGASGEGRWWVIVNHEVLPPPGERAPITGGMWGMVVGERPLRGVITAGAILNNGDGTFSVTPRLDVRAGGAGALALSILLDHAPFPPSVTGSVGAGASAPSGPAGTPIPALEPASRT